MPSLASARPKGKFRPCRADVPKRKVVYADHNGKVEWGFFAYGDRIPGEKLLSAPAEQCVDNVPLRSGVGTAHHLRRFPVLIVCKGGNRRCPLEKRIAEMLEWVKQQFPESKPVAHDEDSIRVILWADDHKKLRETIRNGWLIREC